MDLTMGGDFLKDTRRMAPPKTLATASRIDGPVTDRTASGSAEPGDQYMDAEIDLPPSLQKHVAECGDCSENEDLTYFDLLKCSKDEFNELLEKSKKLVG